MTLGVGPKEGRDGRQTSVPIRSYWSAPIGLMPPSTALSSDPSDFEELSFSLATIPYFGSVLAVRFLA